MFSKTDKKNEGDNGMKFLKDVISNPVTGRITMIGSAVRFQCAVMSLIDDYQKKGIKEVPVSLLSDFIFQSTLHAVDEDVIDKVDEIDKIFKIIEKVTNEQNKSKN